MPSDPEIHRTLARQLRKLRLTPSEPPDPARWTQLTQLVSASYEDADDHRYTLERANEISSNEMRALHDELSLQARHDRLTGLPNRAALIEGLPAALGGARRRGLQAALLFVDLDGFKLVNDSLGHAAGDELLIRAGERIRYAVRATDVVARLGGDEFVIVCPDLENTSQAVAAAQRIVETLQAPFRTGDRDVFVSASVGVAIAGDHEEAPESLLRRADLAMYRAKAQGRSRYVLFDAQMNELAEERLSLEEAIRRAIEQKEFVLHFQPIVRVTDGGIVALEALIRWNRPGHGLVNPDDFIPAAECARLISGIGQWVIGEACREAASWPETHVGVTVNLSAPELAHDGLLAFVGDALHGSGLAPGRLTLELTESTLMCEAGPITQNLHRLRSLGVRVAVDDFGTGYSSLSYLRVLPAHVLKIDRSFIEGIEHDGAEAAIVGAVVTMGHALGLLVVAEGVERQVQLEALRRLGCDAVQGYLLARPMPAADLRWPTPTLRAA